MSRVDDIRKLTAEGEAQVAKAAQEARKEKVRKDEEVKERAKRDAHKMFLEALPQIEAAAAKGERTCSICVVSMAPRQYDLRYYTAKFLVEELQLPENGFKAWESWTEDNGDPDYGEIHSCYVDVSW